MRSRDKFPILFRVLYLWLKLVPPRRVEGGTLVFDVDDVSVQLPGEIKYGAFV